MWIRTFGDLSTHNGISKTRRHGIVRREHNNTASEHHVDKCHVRSRSSLLKPQPLQMLLVIWVGLGVTYPFCSIIHNQKRNQHEPFGFSEETNIIMTSAEAGAPPYNPSYSVLGAQLVVSPKLRIFHALTTCQRFAMELKPETLTRFRGNVLL